MINDVLYAQLSFASGCPGPGDDRRLLSGVIPDVRTLTWGSGIFQWVHLKVTVRN